MSELFKLGVKGALDGMARGEFSSAELVDAVIARFHERNGEIGAYLTFDGDGARAAAKAADEARAAGSALAQKIREQL